MFIKKSAFTLAEILITLTIIGIIAAAVLPRTFGNANSQSAKNKFRATYAQIQKGFKVAKEVDNVSFFEIEKIEHENNSDNETTNVDDFVKKYFGAKIPATGHSLEGDSGVTYQLPNGSQLILPSETVTIIEGNNGCIATSTLNQKCIAFIDINANKAPNNQLGKVLYTGNNNTPDDDTGACMSGSSDEVYAINTEIYNKDCILPKDVYFDIFPVVLEDNDIKPYSNAVQAVLADKNND